MKTIYKTGIVISLLSCSMQSVYAECAKITIKNESGQHYYQVYANQSKNIKPFKESTELFSAGEHSLTILKWGRDDWANYSRSHKFSKIDKIEMLHTTSRGITWNEPVAFNALVNLDKNKEYTFEESTREKGFILREVSEFKCDSEEKYVAESNSQIAEHVKLPEQLLYRFDKAMAALKLKNEGVVTNFVPFTSVLYFGAIPNLSGEANKLLAVTPNSQAAALGLQAGDEIVSLGGTVVQWDENNKDAILNYLKTLDVYDSLSITVKRNGKQLDLTGQYLPEIIPDYTYSFSEKPAASFSLINSQNVDEDFILTFSRLLIEVNQYLSNSGLGNRKLLISRDARYDEKFGMSGNILFNVANFSVERVDKNSPAFQLGLKSGDKITHLNGKQLTNDVREFAIALGDIKQNSSYEMDIIRNGNPITLSGKFIRDKLPMYHVTIDLNSKENALMLMAQHKKYRLWREKTDENQKSVKSYPAGVAGYFPAKID